MSEATPVAPIRLLGLDRKHFIIITPAASRERFERNDAAFSVEAFLFVVFSRDTTIFKRSTDDVSANSHMSDLYSIGNHPTKGLNTSSQRFFAIYPDLFWKMHIATTASFYFVLAYHRPVCLFNGDRGVISGPQSDSIFLSLRLRILQAAKCCKYNFILR
jgi:hypothetical protein